MNKIEYIKKLYNVLTTSNRSEWIEPEYTEVEDKFISEISVMILGQEVSDFIYDVAFGGCDYITIDGITFELKNSEDLVKCMKVYYKDEKWK